MSSHMPIETNYPLPDSVSFSPFSASSVVAPSLQTGLTKLRGKRATL